MTQIVIAKFKLNSSELESDWQKLSAGIQEGISQAPGFISRDTGVDEEKTHYCVVKFNSKEERVANMKDAQEKYPEMFETFAKIVDMTTMEKTEIDID